MQKFVICDLILHLIFVQVKDFLQMDDSIYIIILINKIRITEFINDLRDNALSEFNPPLLPQRVLALL